MEKKIEDYLHLYLGCEVQTPDGIATFVSPVYSVVGKEQIRVHFGAKMVRTKNSVDGGHSKTRNHGVYNIHQQRLEPIGSTGITDEGFDMPGGIKPILRPFSSATDSEILELNKQAHQFDTGNPASHITTDWAYQIDWLIKKRFDVFGLIPAGLALDATVTPISSTTIKP